MDTDRRLGPPGTPTRVHGATQELRARHENLGRWKKRRYAGAWCESTRHWQGTFTSPKVVVHPRLRADAADGGRADRGQLAPLQCHVRRRLPNYIL